jgi:hypothetical protein
MRKFFGSCQQLIRRSCYEDPLGGKLRAEWSEEHAALRGAVGERLQSGWT